MFRPRPPPWLRRTGACLRAGAERRTTGRRGERVAARWLRRRGYRVLARNLRTPRGEIDLLTEHGRWLVVVEVKTSTRRQLVPHRRGPGHAQQRRLRSILRWLRGRPALRGRPIRLDVAFVTLDGSKFVVTIRRDVMRS